MLDEAFGHGTGVGDCGRAFKNCGFELVGRGFRKRGCTIVRKKKWLLCAIEAKLNNAACSDERANRKASFLVLSKSMMVP